MLFISRQLQRMLTGLLLLATAGCVHLENGYDATCAGLIDLSQGLDGFFADPREDEHYNDTRWKIGGGVLLDKDNEYQFTTANKLRIALPGTRESWGILIGGSSERQSILESTSRDEPGTIGVIASDNIAPDQATPSTESYLRVYSKRDTPLKWSFDVGLKYNNDWQGFARLRGKNQGTIGRSSYYFSHQFFWKNTQEEFGTKTQFELDQALHHCAVLREFIEIQYHEASDGLDIYTGLKIRTWAGDKMGVGVEWINFLTTDPGRYKYSDFVCRIRRSIGRDWFELELTPRLRMKRKEHLWELQTSIELIVALTFDADHITRKNGN